MLSVFDVAKSVCELAGWNLTHLKLQKILYILQMFYLGRYNKPLFYANFEAWDYGPVEPGLYKRLKGIGSDCIPEWLLAIEKGIDNDSDEFKFIQELTDALLEKSPSFLINYVHDKNSAWQRLFTTERKHISIPNKEIKAEYDRR